MLALFDSNFRWDPAFKYLVYFMNSTKVLCCYCQAWILAVYHIGVMAAVGLSIVALAHSHLLVLLVMASFIIINGYFKFSKEFDWNELQHWAYLIFAASWAFVFEFDLCLQGLTLLFEYFGKSRQFSGSITAIERLIVRLPYGSFRQLT